MSKRSREKHARPTFTPVDAAPADEQDEMCDECGFFPKKLNSEVCEECAGMEHQPGRYR